MSKTLLSKGSAYVPSPSDINWYKLKEDFNSLVSKLRKHCNQSQFITTEDENEKFSEQSVDKFGPPPPKTKGKIYNFRTKPVSNHSFENFIKIINDNYQRICNSLLTEEWKSFQELC